MKVETFECQETAAEPLEASEEAIELITECGLEGQFDLITPATDKNDTRCPYRMMRKDEIFVYELLCPAKEAAERYNASPIPLRVLQVLSHARSLNFFDHYAIWSAEGEVKDPVLVARKGSAYSGDRYILARWGDELDEWPILCKKAMELWRANTRTLIAQIRNRLKADEEILDSLDMRSAMGTGPTYYGGWTH